MNISVLLILVTEEVGLKRETVRIFELIVVQ